MKHIVKFEEVGIKDVSLVGGKNASLGEMIRTLHEKGVPVPSGFVVTATGYFHFLKETGLDELIKKTLKGLNTKNLDQLHRAGSTIRNAMMKTEFPADLKKEILQGYRELEKRYGRNADVAVRSSATAEDLPGASFAGEQESYLGIRGGEEVMRAVRATMASLFTDRAISYRADRGFDHLKIALSAGVQKMVRSDGACSGVMFSVDTESGFPNIVLINGSWGLGEMIVKGEVTPDEFIVWKEGLKQNVAHPIIEKKLGVKLRKMIYHSGAGIQQTKIINTSDEERSSFVLTDKEVEKLARWGAIIEEHYTKHYKKWTPMDMEWAKDGVTGELFIVQARPETIQAGRDFSKVTEYLPLEAKTPILTGASVGSKIATGKAHVILDTKHIGEFKKGEILITTMTDPDWEPIMKMASAIITDKGGRTSHAAIVSRELGIPAVVGTEKATKMIKTGDLITVDTTGSAGSISRGFMKFKVVEHDLKKIPKPKTKVMVNVAIPDSAFETSFLPNSGVGLAREEFIIASKMGLHPMALLNLDKQMSLVRKAIEAKMQGWDDPKKYYIDNLAFGIAKIGAAFYPNKVIVRFSDFKTNEYRTLLGGEMYEPKEENPMIGWRGASRYYDPKFKPAFMMEAAAMKKVREEMGLTNVIPMVPFCRTPEEGFKVQEAMAEAGLITNFIAKHHALHPKHVALRLINGKPQTTPIYVMCEIPANILLADEFLEIFDGMSIGSNDLTQLTLGLDRDSGIVTKIANENNPAVKKLIAEIIKKCRSQKKYIGICGQAPSDYPDFATFLVEKGIESISLNPDTVVRTTVAIAKKEKQLGRK